MAQKTPKVSGTPPMQCFRPHQLGLLFQNLVVALKGMSRLGYLEDSLNLSLHHPQKRMFTNSGCLSIS